IDHAVEHRVVELLPELRLRGRMRIDVAGRREPLRYRGLGTMVVRADSAAGQRRSQKKHDDGFTHGSLPRKAVRRKPPTRSPGPWRGFSGSERRTRASAAARRT